MGSNGIKIWGSPGVIIIAGSVVAIALGGTRFFPFVVAVYASILLYWVLANTKPS